MFYSIMITYYNSKPASMKKYTENTDGDLVRHDYESYTEAMRELRQLEKQFGRCAQLDVNRYDHTICTKYLYSNME